jgi:hypothetical protein
MVNRVNRRLKPPLDLDARLRAVQQELGGAVDQVWVFTPLAHQDPACEFVLLSCFDGAPDRRRVVVARLCLEPLDEEGHDVRWVQRLEVQGTAPRDVVPRLADRLSRRVGQATTPVVVEIAGAPERWQEFLRALAGNGANANGHDASAHRNGHTNGNGTSSR